MCPDRPRRIEQRKGTDCQERNVADRRTGERHLIGWLVRGFRAFVTDLVRVPDPFQHCRSMNSIFWVRRSPERDPCASACPIIFRSRVLPYPKGVGAVHLAGEWQSQFFVVGCDGGESGGVAPSYNAGAGVVWMQSQAVARGDPTQEGMRLKRGFGSSVGSGRKRRGRHQAPSKRRALGRDAQSSYWTSRCNSLQLAWVVCSRRKVHVFPSLVDGPRVRWTFAVVGADRSSANAASVLCGRGRL